MERALVSICQYLEGNVQKDGEIGLHWYCVSLWNLEPKCSYVWNQYSNELTSYTHQCIPFWLSKLEWVSFAMECFLTKSPGKNDENLNWGLEAGHDGYREVNEATQGLDKWAEWEVLTEVLTKYWRDTKVGPTIMGPTCVQAVVVTFLLWERGWWRTFLPLIRPLSPLKWTDV